MVNTKEDTSKNKIIGLWKYLLLYYKIAIAHKKRVDGYVLKNRKTLPIVGNHFYEGYEIINPNTKKVLYRRLKDHGYIDDVHDIPSYTITSEFFKQNIIDYDKIQLIDNSAIEIVSRIIIRILKIFYIVTRLYSIMIFIILLPLTILILIFDTVIKHFVGRSVMSDYSRLLCKIL